MHYEKSDEPIVAMRVELMYIEPASQDVGGDCVRIKLDLAKGF